MMAMVHALTESADDLHSSLDAVEIDGHLENRSGDDTDVSEVTVESDRVSGDGTLEEIDSLIDNRSAETRATRDRVESASGCEKDSEINGVKAVGSNGSDGEKRAFAFDSIDVEGH